MGFLENVLYLNIPEKAYFFSRRDKANLPCKSEGDDACFLSCRPLYITYLYGYIWISFSTFNVFKCWFEILVQAFLPLPLVLLPSLHTPSLESTIYKEILRCFGTWEIWILLSVGFSYSCAHLLLTQACAATTLTTHFFPCAAKQNIETFLTTKIALHSYWNTYTYTYPHSGL